MRALVFISVCVVLCSAAWQDWITNYGSDIFLYPDWVQQQMTNCFCKSSSRGNKISTLCFDRKNETDAWATVNLAAAPKYAPLTYCLAKQWLLRHMPEFDLHYLPPSVSVNGSSMFDDNIVFALMADNASRWTSNIPLDVKLAYLLPYATFHEARQNWRPILFSKFFSVVAPLSSTVSAITALTRPYFPRNTFTNWSAELWPSYPDNLKNTNFYLQWRSSTSPPVASPADFVTYGYGSCTAWSTLLTYIARSVGIPARQVSSPCWNGDEFAGLAKDNPNVLKCWHGGAGNAVGGRFLNNHNWVEYWDDVSQKWVFINVPPENAVPNQGLCATGRFSEQYGCDYDPVTGCKDAILAGAASRDHEIFSVTWHYPDEATPGVDGGEIIDVRNLRLTSGDFVSPLVWSPYLASPIGEPLKDVGLRVVNRTEFYRCKTPTM